MKDEEQDPYPAFMLALILFWGFSRKELVYSASEMKDDAIEITVYQAPLSYAHKTPTRNGVLKQDIFSCHRFGETSSQL
jgi:hypothetical protein